MTAGTVLSRVTGLLRLAAIAAALGVAESRLPDTYNLANTAPNIIYELVLGGILTSVFVPIFVELLETEGRERAWEVASGLINVAMLVLVALAAIGVLAAPLLASFYAARLGGEAAALQQDVLTFLLRLFIPQIVFYGLAAMTAGALNAHNRFGPPMFTPVLNNLLVIAVFVLFYRVNRYVTLETVTSGQLLLLGLGTTAGVAAMALAQLPFLRGLGTYRWNLSVAHPSIRKLARLSVFVFGYVIANQVGYFIVQWLANGQQGGYSAYVYAFTFFMLPHGLFAVSVITALLPGMSEHAVNERWGDFVERLSTGIRATIVLVLPAAVGYLVLGEAVVRFLLQRGVMTGASTDLVADVLRVFVLGLVPFSLFQLFLRAFYALQDTKTPFMINLVAVALNIAIDIPLFMLFGVEGLAAGHAASYVLGVTLQARYLRRRVGSLDGRRIARSFAKVLGAALAMGGVVLAAAAGVRPWLEGSDALRQAVALTGVVALGVASYLGVAASLRVEEVAVIRGLATRRFKRSTV